MKKYLLVLLTISAIHASYSQTQTGKMFIGGQINLFGGSNSILDTLYRSDQNSSGFSIAPNFGYFIKDNFAIGLNINLGYSNYFHNNEYYNHTPSISTHKSNYFSYGFGGFARHYIKLASNFMFYVNGGINYTYTTNEMKSTDSNPNENYSASSTRDNRRNNIGLSVSPGLIYFMTPKLGLHTSFGSIYYDYSTSTDKNIKIDNYDNSSNYGINLNFTTLYIGLNYYF